MSMSEVKASIEGFPGRVVVIALGIVTSIFSTVAMFTLLNIQDKQRIIDDRVLLLQTQAAVIQSNHFSARDWNTAATDINNKFNNLDVRVTRMEESQKQIASSLSRIENTLGSKPQS